MQTRAGAGCVGAGQWEGWIHPSGHFPGSEHMGTRSLVAQLTLFLPHPSAQLLPLCPLPETHTAGPRN